MQQLNISEIKARIAQIGEKQAATNQDIHEVLCHATMHALTIGNGDVTAFGLLFESVKGADRKAIAKWVHDFTPAKLRDDGTVGLNKTRFKELRDVLTLDELLNGVSWSDYVPDMKQVARSFDYEARVMSLIEQGETFELEEKGTVKNADLASYLKTALLKYHEAIEMRIAELKAAA